jgi:hypothetical protein
VFFVGDDDHSPLEETVYDVLGKRQPDLIQMIAKRRLQLHVVSVFAKADSTGKKLATQHSARGLHSRVALEHVLKSIDLRQIQSMFCTSTRGHSQGVRNDAVPELATRQRWFALPSVT